LIIKKCERQGTSKDQRVFFLLGSIKISLSIEYFLYMGELQFHCIVLKKEEVKNESVQIQKPNAPLERVSSTT
jgi:hypothetical protein